jgi:glutamate synthase domain-containing protein 2
MKIFTAEGLNEKVVFVGSGKLGLADSALFAFALGCDWVNVGREAMLAIGCLQTLKCHTNHCPTGVATQNQWLIRGLDPELKAARLANYILTLRKDLLSLSRACGVPHPSMVGAEHLEMLDDRFGSKTVAEVFGYGPGYGLPSSADIADVRKLMPS